MKKSMLCVALVFAITLSSCSKDDSKIEKIRYEGFYKIKSINSDEFVDLNGDSHKSKDLKLEIDNYFDHNGFDLEIGPNDTNVFQHELISIYFPEPQLSFENPDHPDGFVQYAKSTLGFEYEFDNNHFLLIDPNNSFMIIDKIELLDDGTIRSVIHKDYYDFESQNWKKLNIEVIYYRTKYYN